MKYNYVKGITTVALRGRLIRVNVATTAALVLENYPLRMNKPDIIALAAGYVAQCERVRKAEAEVKKLRKVLQALCDKMPTGAGISSYYAATEVVAAREALEGKQ